MKGGYTGQGIRKAIDLEPAGWLGRPEETADAMLWMSVDLGVFVIGALTFVEGECSL